MNLEKFGFKTDFIENGRPAYHPVDLLKLYIYGYLNRIRSSRQLEKECKRNIEVIWLVKSLRPDHNTISNFRRDNPKAIKKVFRETVKIAQYFTALYDKGYHTGSELAIADELDISAIVAIPPFSGASHAPDLNYDVEHFDYDPNSDTYTCPQGHTLSTTGTWHEAKNSNGEILYRFRNYTTPQCKTCEVRPLCAKSAVNGKQVRRSEYAEHIENNKKRVLNSEKLYKRRQAIVEHPFGTIKRQWGFNYIITKKHIERVEADFGFVMTAYNLRRLINIIGLKSLQAYLAGIFSFLLAQIAGFELFLSHLNQLIERTMKKPEVITGSANHRMVKYW